MAKAARCSEAALWKNSVAARVYTGHHQRVVCTYAFIGLV